MTLPVSCPRCDNMGNVPEKFQGRPIRCKRCNTRFTVPAGATQAALLQPVSAWPVYLEDMPPMLVDCPRPLQV